MESFELEIIRPSQSQIYQVTGIEVKGVGGSFFVGVGHAPLISLLQPKERLVFTTVDGNAHAISISGGLVSVEEHRTLVILND